MKKLSAVVLFVFVAGALFAISFDSIINEKTINAAKKSSDAFSKVTEDISLEQEYYIGRAVAAEILGKYKLYNNVALQTYLTKICNTLVLYSSRPELYVGYRIGILRSDELNAFATPGGHILITTGMLRCCRSEDAIAAVIAHEIGHIQLQHATKAIRSSRTKEAFSALGDTIEASLSDTKLGKMTEAFNTGVGDITDTLMSSGYSKSQEFDADSEAVKLLANAGYDPNGLIDMLTVLGEKSDKSKAFTPEGIFSTHPAPATRISKARFAIFKYSPVTTQEKRVKRFSAAVKGL